MILAALAVSAVGSAAVLAQAPNTQPPGPLTFFVATSGPGTGKLGGLAGADKICQDEAAANGAGNRTWRAYLSQEARDGLPAINARDRIGTGPWYNSKGVKIAENLDQLHGDTVRDRNNIKKSTSLNVKGEIIKGFGDTPNQHDILTGTDSTGRAFTDGVDHTCKNWTSDEGVPGAQLGHSDREGGSNTSWNSAHLSRGCDNMNLTRTGGAGFLYCFASN